MWQETVTLPLPSCNFLPTNRLCTKSKRWMHHYWDSPHYPSFHHFQLKISSFIFFFHKQDFFPESRTKISVRPWLTWFLSLLIYFTIWNKWIIKMIAKLMKPCILKDPLASTAGVNSHFVTTITLCNILFILS